MSVAPIRYRARMGKPRGWAERVLQWAWRYRCELVLGYIAGAVTATLLYQFGLLG